MTATLRIAGCALIGAAALVPAWGQQPMTPYERSMQQQQLYDRQQQNARQEQQLQQQQRDQQWNDTLRQQQAQQGAATAQGQAVLRSWQQRPPLASDKNPLLGRWNSLGSAGAKRSAPSVSPEMAELANALLGGITGGMCDSMLGRGLVEFRPNAVVAIGAGGREQVMYQAEYRGGGSRVVVLPHGATSFTHMIIDFNGRDQASVAAVGCGLTRVGGAASAGGGAAHPIDVAAAVAGVQWESAGSNHDGDGYYLARVTIRRSGDTVKLWDMYDFKVAHLSEGKPMLSMRSLWHYDCRGARRRMLAATAYAGHLGKGAVVGSENFANPGAWEPIGADESYGRYVLKLACART